MVNEENLIPISSRPARERIEMGRRGGRVRSPSKKLKAKMRELKKSGKTPEKVKHLVSILEDKEVSAFDILQYIFEIKEKCESLSDQLKIARLQLDWHKAFHGQRIEVQSSPEDQMRNEVNAALQRAKEIIKQQGAQRTD